ncbi:hypothetical protein [Neorhodopirellula lusitana]|uniref:hypothetical protein n=1 Tax=Neorhodopirellula lusitana TaxID=445327 RepID=UPI003850B281
MRIPSQLHRDPLYRRNGKVGTGATAIPPDQSWRRVVRLGVVLALVLVLMRQAAKPVVYEVFFPAQAQSVVPERSPNLGAHASEGPLTTVEPPSSDQGLSSGQGTSVLTATPFVLDVDQQAAADQQTSSWTTQQATDFLANWLSGNPADAALPPLPTDSTETTESNTQPATVYLALACRQHLIMASKDGTVWRSADGPALSATLAMHDPAGSRFHLLRSATPSGQVAGVLPLLQQPEVYRGRSVIAEGDVVRIEQVVASDNPFDLDYYWNLWLKPKDASSRPWLVVVAQLPQEMKGLVPSAAETPTGGEHTALSSWEVKSPFPTVTIHGEFLKRLTYQSAAGPELTPVVAGHVEFIQANGNPAISVSQGSAQRDDDAAPAPKPSMAWIVMAAIGIGGIFSAWVMWRTASLNRQLRKRRSKRPVTLEAGLLAFLCCFPANAFAESILDLLPGFDQSNLQAITWPVDAEPIDVSGLSQLHWDDASLAKLIYRLNRLSDNILQQRQSTSATGSGPHAEIGDAIEIDGVITELKSMPVPDELNDMLELHDLQLAKLKLDDNDFTIVAFEALPVELEIGDRLTGTGALIGQYPEIDVRVAGRLHWNPARPMSPAGDFLSASGVDLSRLPEVAKLDRQSLSASDSPVFFPAIGAARRVSLNRESSEVQRLRASVVDASPVDLLKSPSQFTGHWIRLRVETVRATRVAVESTERRKQIGGDEYYQIDAIGDLGNVQLKLEVPDGDPVVMENRYPVTIVTATLPDFLRNAQDDSLVTTKTIMVQVEGFFYRLWSYDSDLMTAHGGKQFAPLIVAGVIEDLSPKSTDPIGVNSIGRVAAFGVIFGIIAVIAFGWITRRGDRASRERRYRSDL